MARLRSIYADYEEVGGYITFRFCSDKNKKKLAKCDNSVF